MLVASLPDILPFPAEDIRTEVLTGTVDMQDEIVPDDEDEDINYRTRAKSSLSVVVIIGDGVDESIAGGSKWDPRGKRRKRAAPVWPRTEDVVASELASQKKMRVAVSNSELLSLVLLDYDYRVALGRQTIVRRRACYPLPVISYDHHDGAA
jgi:hypothetical protein